MRGERGDDDALSRGTDALRKVTPTSASDLVNCLLVALVESLMSRSTPWAAKRARAAEIGELSVNGRRAVTGVQHVSGRGVHEDAHGTRVSVVDREELELEAAEWHFLPLCTSTSLGCLGEPMLLELALYEAQGELVPRYGNGTVRSLRYGSAPV